MTARAIIDQSSLLDAVGYAVIGTDLSGEIVAWNKAAEALYGWSADAVLGRNIVEVTPAPDSVLHANEIMERLRAGEAWQGEFLVRDRSGRQFPIEIVNNPVFNDAGELVGVVGVSNEISARKQAQRQHELVLHELHHRLNNTLMSVLAIARQTMRGAEDGAQFLAAFEDRLSALARTHALLDPTRAAKIDLFEIVAQEMKPFPDRIRVSGEAIEVNGKVAMVMAMCLHELATNAAKHGALSNPDGRVDLSWRVESEGSEGPRLALQWLERSGPPAAPPERTGFGSILMPQLIEPLGGTIERRFPSEGLECTLTAPLGSGD